jgi:hypothetical protein
VTPKGFHDLSIANHPLRGPSLTPLAVNQYRKHREDLPYMKQVGLVASPLKRTICKALYALDDVLCVNELQIVALPEAQETTDLSYDTSSSVDELKEEFRGKPVNLNHLSRTWNRKDGKWFSIAENVTVRAKEAWE